MTPRSLWLTLLALGCGMLLLQGLGLYLQVTDHYDGVLGVTLTQGCLYLAAVFCAMRTRVGSRSIVFLVLAVAMLLRVATVGFPPYLSSDMYRYVWDGEVQGAGINPYRYAPGDDSLASLRDSVIYPNINRASYARTIYPPAAQLIFLAVTRVSPTVLAMKVAMLAFDLATIFLLLRFLRELRAPPGQILIYAWHPLVIWEVAGSGHVDAALGVFVVAGLLARHRNMPSLAGFFVALATLVKFLPIAILPAVYRRWDWRLPAAFAATAICLYLPYLSVGRDALGFLPNYLGEERLTAGTGSGYFIVNLLSFLSGWRLPVIVYLAIALLVLACLSLLAIKDSAKVVGNRYLCWSLWLATAVLVLVTPHYPWYFIWLLPLVCLVPRWPVLVLTAASFVLYAVLKERSPDRELAFNSLLYGAFLLAALGQLWVHRMRSRLLENPQV